MTEVQQQNWVPALQIGGMEGKIVRGAEYFDVNGMAHVRLSYSDGTTFTIQASGKADVLSFWQESGS